MKFLLDNNLPPAFSKALDALSQRFGHSVCHLRDVYSPDTPDIEWIHDLKQKGNWAIVSQDHFSKNNLEKKALRDCGLLVFCLDRHWASTQYWEKAQNLVRWWPSIIQQADLISGGAAFKVPWRHSGGRKFEQMKFQ